MRSLLLGALAIFIFIVVNCNAIKEIGLQAKTDTSINTIATLPFDYKKQLIVVDATLNNAKAPNQFIFDTGAFQSKVAYNLANKLDLATITKRKNGTAQGIKKTIEITCLDTIQFPDANFFNIAAGKLKYDAKSFSPCVAADGIIGSNLIKLAHWKIDYQYQEIQISKTPIPPAKNEALISIDFETSFLSGVPKIDIEIEGTVIEDVIFDLGYNGGLIVPAKFANVFQSNATQTIIDESTAGIFGTNRDTLIVKELKVKLGEISTEIPVEFSSLNKALIGNDFLEHFTIYLDYKTNKIKLHPVSPIAITPVKTFIPAILNDSLWIVSRTNSQIPLEIGDTLTKVEGYRPIDLYQSHCDHFLNISKLLHTKVLSIEMINNQQIQINL